jgi:hypothetical protein
MLRRFVQIGFLNSESCRFESCLKDTSPSYRIISKGGVMRCIFHIVCILLAFTSIAAARTWYVPSEAATIQAGIDSSAVGDTVVVACGTYHEYDIVMKSGIVLTSETGIADCVVIDAQGLGRGLICQDIDETTEVIGITIFRGSSMPSGIPDRGAGVLCENASMGFINCTFRLNTAFSEAAGMFVDWHSSINLTGCVFEQNTTQDGAGAGLYCQKAMRIFGCQFVDNHADSGAGAALFTGTSTVEVTGCLFSGNESGGYGGAIELVEGVSATFDRCTISGNTCLEKGGGLHAEGSGLTTLLSCSIYGNSAGESGGGVFTWTELSATNTDITGNDAPLGADGYAGDITNLRCCLVDLARWAIDPNQGELNLDNEGCGISSEVSSWGNVKALYR